MNTLEPTKQKTSRKIPQLLAYYLLCSLALHLLFILILQGQTKHTKSKLQKPIIINMIEQKPTIKNLTKTPPKKKKNEIDVELDQQPPIRKAEIKTKSLRKAVRSQMVPHEMAPKGHDTRDRTIQVQTPNRPLKPIPQNKSLRTESKIINTIKLDDTKSPTISVTSKKKQPIPTLEQLFPDPSFMKQIAQGKLSNYSSYKERPYIDTGDAVLLNTQSNQWVSFLKRVIDRIGLNWQLPYKEMIINNLEGVTTLMITINRKGELIDVDVYKTSGSDLLDFVSITAVYGGAPFGPFPKRVPRDKVKVLIGFIYEGPKIRIFIK